MAWKYAVAWPVSASTVFVYPNFHLQTSIYTLNHNNIYTYTGKAGPNTERGTERERNGTRTREMPVQHLGDSRLPSAFLAAGKMQMAIHNSYLLHLVIPSAFSAASKMQMVSFAFSRFTQENQLASFSNIFAFCYRHKMQLGTLDCGTRSFAFLAAGKKQFITIISCIWSFHLHLEPLAKCKWFLLHLYTLPKCI